MNNDQIEGLAWAKQDGLLPAIVQDADSLQVLMLGYMNAEALAATLASGRVTFFSRSKNRLWTKGESSGHFLGLVSLEADCDNDTLLVQARPNGDTCHLNRPSCFPQAPKHFLSTLEDRINGLPKVAQKVGEEAVETVIAALAEDETALLNESADLLYHLLLLLRAKNVGLQQVIDVLKSR